MKTAWNIFVKTLRIIERVVIAIAVVMFLSSWCLTLLFGRSVVPKDFQEKTETGGNIEAKYLQNGSHEVSLHEESVLQEFKKFLVYYPSDLEKGDAKYPVLVFCNGSGTPLSKYASVAKHYASWGFIAIGTQENYSWNAFGAEMCVRYLERMNDNQKVGDKDSFLYQKVDFDNVGVVGHSQGGVGAINAITNIDHKETFKTAVALSPTNITLARNLMWNYDPSLVNIPIMLVSGAGGGDDWVVNEEQLQEIYDEIPSEKLKIRRQATIHGEVLYKPTGYATAWFMWKLQGDEEAGKAFAGDDAEIFSNELYQDQERMFSE